MSSYRSTASRSIHKGPFTVVAETKHCSNAYQTNAPQRMHYLFMSLDRSLEDIHVRELPAEP